MTYLEEATVWLSRALDHISHAKDNHRIGIHHVAISLCYYASFYAAKAVLAYLREDTKTHSGVMNRFWERAVKGSDFPGEVASLLPQLFDKRLKADYDITWDDRWDEEEAAKTISDAEKIVTEVSNWFKRHDILPANNGV